MQWLSVLCLTVTIVGCGMAVRGFIKRRVSAITLGTSLFFYSLTGENYSSLTTGHTLTTLERVWGATSAVLAGTACIATLLLARKDRLELSNPGNDWTDWLHQRVLAVGMFTSISISFIFLAIKRYDLRPSANFLDDYGHLPGVMVYQVIFAIWIMLPMGLLGISLLDARRLGSARYLTCVSGFLGVLWGTWKLVGVLAAAMGRSLPADSEVSVSIGLATLILFGLGAGLSTARSYMENRRSSAAYERTIISADNSFRRAGS